MMAVLLLLFASSGKAQSGKKPAKRVAKATADRFLGQPALVATEQMADSYGGVPGLPETFFIDRNGKVVAHEIGLESQRTIEKHIQKALKGK